MCVNTSLGSSPPIKDTVMEHCRGVTVLPNQGDPGPVPLLDWWEPSGPGRHLRLSHPRDAARHPLRQGSSNIKNDPAQYVNSAKAEKLCPIPWLPLPPHGQSRNPLYAILSADMFAQFCKGHSDRKLCF